jgi:hypothetical protein
MQSSGDGLSPAGVEHHQPHGAVAEDVHQFIGSHNVGAAQFVL